jgi:glycosyltransferase involved in cell wall biosynthesis
VRCLFVNDHIGAYGGVERYIFFVSAALEKRGFEVAYLHSRIGERTTAGHRQAWHVPEIEDTAGKLSDKAKEHVLEILTGWQPDVIYWHNFSHPGLLEFMLESKPVVIFQHTLDAVCPGGRKFFRSGKVCPIPMSVGCLIRAYLYGCATIRPWRLFGDYRRVRKMQALARRCEKVVVASRFVADRLAETGIPSDMVEIAPLFASPLAFSTKVTGPDSPNRIFCVGRFANGKGQAELLKALRNVESPYYLVLAGEGREKTKLEKLAARLPEGSYEIRNYLNENEMSAEYRKAAFIVFPSVLHEPFGLAGVEALAYGRAVIAFGGGGVPEWLIPNGDSPSGIIVPLGDVDALRFAIERALTDPEAVMEMGRTARTVAEGHFTLAKHADRIGPILKTAATKKSG